MKIWAKNENFKLKEILVFGTGMWKFSGFFLQSLKNEKKSSEDFTKISEFTLSQSSIQLSNKI